MRFRWFCKGAAALMASKAARTLSLRTEILRSLNLKVCPHTSKHYIRLQYKPVKIHSTNGGRVKTFIFFESYSYGKISHCFINFKLLIFELEATWCQQKQTVLSKYWHLQVAFHHHQLPIVYLPIKIHLKQVCSRDCYQAFWVPMNASWWVWQSSWSKVSYSEMPRLSTRWPLPGGWIALLGERHKDGSTANASDLNRKKREVLCNTFDKMWALEKSLHSFSLPFSNVTVLLTETI